MAIAISGLTGEHEAAFADELARGVPVLGLLSGLLARTAVGDDGTAVEASRLTAGEAQALALRLRAAGLKGPMRPTFACTGCGEQLDLTIDPLDLIVPGGPGEAMVVIDGITFSCRAIAVADILAAAGERQPRAAALSVLTRCVTASDGSGHTVAIASLPDDVVDQVAAQLLALDPQAETVLSSTCPSCGTSLEAVLDPAQFLAAELAGQTRALFVDVLAIAARTGWTEAAILAMPRHRRRGYAAALGVA